MRFRSRLLVTVVLLAGVACGDGGAGPSHGGPGTLDLVLTTPYQDDGGLLIAVTGSGITAVSSSSYEVTHDSPGQGGVTLLLRGDIGGGVVAQITVSDRGRLGKYRATVLQAAQRGPGYQQRSPAGYGLRLVAP